MTANEKLRELEATHGRYYRLNVGLTRYGALTYLLTDPYARVETRPVTKAEALRYIEARMAATAICEAQGYLAEVETAEVAE